MPISATRTASPAKPSVDRTDGNAAFYELIGKPFARNDLDNFNKYPDIEIIKRDGTAIDKTFLHDVPADIELIPMSSDQSSSPTTASLSHRRAPKRSFSPVNDINKLTRLNDFSHASTSSQAFSKFTQLNSECSIKKISYKVPKSNKTNESQSTFGSTTTTITITSTAPAAATTMASVTTVSPTQSPSPSSTTHQAHIENVDGVADANVDADTETDADADPDDDVVIIENIQLSSNSVLDEELLLAEASAELMALDPSREEIEKHVLQLQMEASINNEELKHLQHFSNDSSECSSGDLLVSSGSGNNAEIPDVSTFLTAISTSSNSENVGDMYDASFNNNATDNLISGGSASFGSTIADDSAQDDATCANISDDSIFKIQNFEGVLQIQPDSLIMDQQPKLYSHIIEDGIVQDDMIIANNPAIGEDSSNSTATMADCSGDNSADTGVEELEPTIQNLEPVEDDPIEQKFTDAENYVLESGEISGDSGGMWRP